MDAVGKRPELGIQPPKQVSHILKVLQDSNYQAYIVGGCVRDAVLSKEPKDWDITTDAAPTSVKELFPKTIDTGLKHGTVTVMLDGVPYEVTTFRIDGNYSDGRHPEIVEFTGQLEEDLRRRDFTINAMAWNPNRGLVDPYGGLQDIAAGCIRAVGNPCERFQEDALRMLRAVRFAARLGFEIQRRTLNAITENSFLIQKVSVERIREELTGILLSDNPLKLKLLLETSLLKLILPELEECFHIPQKNPHHVWNVGEHCLQAAASIESEVCLRWAMLLHDIGKAATRATDELGIDHFHGHAAKSVEIAGHVLKKLRFDNKTMDKILRLVKYHDREIQLQPRAVAKAVHSVGKELFPDLIKVKRADRMAQNPADIEEGLKYLDLLQGIYNEILSEEQCLNLKDLAVDGRDLIELGFVEGREIGQVLADLLENVLETPSLNNKADLLSMAVERLVTIKQGNKGSK